MLSTVLNYFLVTAESTFAAAESTFAAAESTLLAAESKTVAAESTKAAAESAEALVLVSAPPQEAKATVKANPKKANLNEFFILIFLN